MYKLVLSLPFDLNEYFLTFFLQCMYAPGVFHTYGHMMECA